MLATQRLTMVVAVALLAACSDGGGASAPSSPGTTEPAITPPPTLTPEEQAETDIHATFEELIADRDAYYSNAGDYELEDVMTNSPATKWNVTGQAELEMSNWTVLWRQGGLEQVGSIAVVDHHVSSVDVAQSEHQAAQAVSVACLDMTSLGYTDPEGSSADLGYEPDRSQSWEMTWIFFPSTAPQSGVDEPGWHVRTIEVSRNLPC